MMTKEQPKRPPLFLATGLIFGLIVGIIFAWIIWPPKVATVGPANLSDENKAEYRLLVALAYASSGDLGRANARIALVGDNDPARTLASQAQIALADSSTQREARALASLATDLSNFSANVESTSVAVNTPNPEDQGALATPFQTDGDTNYELSSQELLCESASTPPLLKLFVFDERNQPQAGVKLSMNSDEGEDEFFTGERPDFGPGYAEYEMTPQVVYTLSINGTQVMGGLKSAACETEDGEPAWGTWLLLFNAPELN
jgi:hypothetical protein